MTFEYVGEVNANSGAAGLNALSAPAAAHAGGNHLFVHIQYYGGDSTTAIVTDTAGNQYEPCIAHKTDTQNMWGQWFYCLSAVGHASNVVNMGLAAARNGPSMRVMEFASPSAVFDKEIPAMSSGSTTTSTPSFDTPRAGVVLVGQTSWNDEVNFDYGENYTELPRVYAYSKEGYRITNGALTGEVVTATGTVTTSRGLQVLSIVESGVATAPGAPTNITATAGNTSASVEFTAPSNGGSPITGYTVTSSPGGIAATGTTSPINVTGLTNGIAYTFAVKATNSVGTGAESAASNAVTPNPMVTLTLKSRAGAVAANETGIKWAWWDSTDLSTLGAPTNQGAVEAADANGEIVIAAPASVIASGQGVLLALLSSDGTKRFFGIVTVD